MLALSLVVTLTAFNFARQEAAQHLDHRFASAAKEIADDIRERMAHIEESLHASRAFVFARKDISREEWRTFQNNQAIENYHPGTFGIGMAPQIRRQDADTFVRAIRRHDHVDYKIWPAGDRAVYAPIRFTASHNGDTRALGLDMYSEPRRRAAMERARDTGEASLSGLITLVRAGDKESRESVILFLPVYRHTLPPDASVDQRRAAFVSYVYCPILIAEFWRDAIARASQMNVAVQITDADRSTVLPAVRKIPADDNALTLKSDKDVYGRRWDFEFRAMPGFADTGLRSRAAIVAVAGLAISLLLFGMVWLLTSTKLRAEAIARNMTRALRDSEGRLRSLVEQSPDAMIMHQDAKIVFVNNAMVRLMRVADAAALIGQPALSIVDPRRRKIAEQRIRDLYVNKTLPLSEQVYVRADGTTVDVEVAAVSFELDARAAALVTVRDISERKKQEAENERLRRLYAALSQINQAIVWMPTRNELFQKICDVLVEHGGFRLAWIGWHAPQSSRLIPVAQSGDDGGYLEGVTIYTDDRPEGKGPAGTAFREGKPYICRDFLGDPSTLPWRAEAARRGFRAAAVFPIRLKGEVSGTLAVYAADTESFEDKEISLLVEAAIDVSFALDNFARDEARQQAEVSVKRLAAIVESTDDAIIAKTLQGIITDWNPAAQRLFGYTAGEMIGRSIQVLIPPDRAAEEDQILARVGKGEHIRHFETVRLRKDGQTIAVSVTISPIWAPDDAVAGETKIVGAAKIVRDISERKRAEEGLQRFYMAMQTSQDGIFLMDFETFRYLDVNETGCRMLGYSREELLTMRTLDTNPGMTESQQRRRFDEAKALGSEHVLTEPEGRTMRHKNGSVFPIEVARRSLRIGEKELVVGVARDISVLTSTRLRGEKIAHDLTGELREREHRFRTLWETTNDAVVLLDDQGRIQYASPALRDVFGYDPGDVIGKDIEFLQPSHLRAGHRAGFTRYLRTGNKTVNWRSVQTSGLHRKGHEVPVEIAFSQMDFDGRPGFAGFIRDITERKRAEEALRESEYKYRQIVELSPDAVTIHEDGKWVFANPAAARLLGVEQPSQLIGRSLLDFMHPDMHEQARQRWKRLYEDRQPVSPVEQTMIKPDGSIVYLETSGAPVVWQGRPAAQAIARDVTESKKAKAALEEYARQLQGLSRRLIEVEEAERRNINRELHDRIGQNLSALGLSLNLIRSRLPENSQPDIAVRLDNTQALLEETTAQVRNVMADLHPPALEDYGLFAALRTHVEFLRARAGIPIEITGEDVIPRLSPVEEMGIFRIAQEAIANAFKHARATYRRHACGDSRQGNAHHRR